MRTIFKKFAISYPRKQASLGCLLGALALLCTACSSSDSPSLQTAVLIRTDQQTITLGQFDRAFEAARIAYSDQRAVPPAVIHNARMRLLNQMAEELIIDRRSKELGIALAEAEVEAAIAKIKGDYPEDAFEQMLLESAIPFSLWKERLQARLLMEKVVDHELIQPLTISAQDIEAYYKAHEDEFAVADGKPPESDVQRQIVERLRRAKVEAAYPQWMEGLRQRYQVEIDWQVWEKAHGAGLQSPSSEKEAS